MIIADGILLVGLALLLVVILGTMRETVILRGDVAALSQLITNPPQPSYVGTRIPALIESAVGLGEYVSRCDSRTHVLLFLRIGCNGCESLLIALQEAVHRESVPPSGISCVVAAPTEDAPVFQMARRVSENVVLDRDGTLFKGAEVRGAPTQLALWVNTLEVFDCQLGGDVGWIMERLQRQQPESTTLTSV